MNIDTDKLDLTKQNERIAAWCLGVELQYWNETYKCWWDVTELACLTLWAHREYRRKPIETPKRTITIPQCLTEAPAFDTKYWRTSSNNKTGFAAWAWINDDSDKDALANGICFAKEEDAKAFVAAMRGSVK